MKKNPIIKVIGIGGSGSNTISRMMKKQISRVELIAINTDAQDLLKKSAHKKIRIGEKLTRGLGAGMNPEIGKKAAEEQKNEILEVLKDSDIIFITTGLGGGTGSGASPYIAQLAQSLNILTIGIVSLPFYFEGKTRKKIAEESLRKLKENLDALIAIPNDNLLKILNPNVSLEKAFDYLDNILYEAVKTISDLLFLPGIISVSLNDIQTVLKKSGTSYFGIGVGKGENKEAEAIEKAFDCPLLNLNIGEAKKLLFSVSGKNISLEEIEKTIEMVKKRVRPDIKIAFGAVQDEGLNKNELKVVLILTGF
jgi:cell division protein FtsZ